MKVDLWPYEANQQSDKGTRFNPVTLTVREFIPARDGTSQAGREYHIPPRLTFEEDIERNEWQWKEWVDSRPVDYPGPYPLAGDIVQAKLKVTKRDDGTYWYDIDEVVATGNHNTPTAQAGPTAPEVNESGTDTEKSPLGMLPVEQRIAATALTNVLVGRVWDETPDGDEWKETMRAAVKKITLAQVPPSLIPTLTTTPAPWEDDDSDDPDDLTDTKEKTETIDW